MLLSSDLQLAITAAKEAGKIVQEGFGKILQIEKKADGKGIVTDVDKKSEEIIIKVLQKSSYPILAEEGGLVGKKSNTYWVVDPLDGTSNFSQGLPFFGITIALLRNNQVEIGVTFNPITSDCFYTQRGKGAYQNGKPIKVSSLSANLIFLSFGYTQEGRTRFVKAAEILLKNGYFIRKFGSSAIELCYLAKGTADAFICSGDELWDYAAGIILVEEAGGKVTDWKGNLWNNTNSFILATNGVIHEALLKQISDLQKE